MRINTLITEYVSGGGALGFVPIPVRVRLSVFSPLARRIPELVVAVMIHDCTILKYIYTLYFYVHSSSA
jgi:hypothetical protein